MKKFKFSFATMMVAMLTMWVAFTSCSSDDDDTVAAAKEIAGSYTSSLDMTVMGQASTYENVTMKIEAVDDATVKITLPACGDEGMMALPALEVPAVKVSGSNGAYAFSQENYAGTVTVNGAEKKYTVTLQGTLKDKTLTVNYSVQYGKMPMPMIAKFVCTK